MEQVKSNTLIEDAKKELEDESNAEAKKVIKKKLKEIRDAKVVLRNLERELANLVDQAENGLL